MSDPELTSQLERLAANLDKTGKPASASVVRSAVRRIDELKAARDLDELGGAGADEGEGLFSWLFGGGGK